MAAPLIGLSVRDPRVAQRENYIVRDPNNDRSFPVNTLSRSFVPTLIRQRFGEGLDRWNLFRIGPHSAWLGQPLSSLTQKPGFPVKLECFAPTGNNRSAELTRTRFHIQGRVLSPADPQQPIDLIVSVAGTICGTTRTYRQSGYTDRWEVMLPEWSYPPQATASKPAITPEFFAVDPSDQSITPCRVQWAAAQDENPE